MIRARGVDPVLITYDLPELCTDLVAALAALDVNDLTHGECWSRRSGTAWDLHELRYVTYGDRLLYIQLLKH